MSQTGWNARLFQVYVDGQIVAAVRSKSVSFSSEAIDISDGEADGYRRLAEVGDVQSIQVQVEGVATSANYAQLRALWESDEFASVDLRSPDGTSIVSNVTLSGLSRTGGHADAITFSATLVLSGEPRSALFLTTEIAENPSGGILLLETFPGGDDTDYAILQEDDETILLED